MHYSPSPSSISKLYTHAGPPPISNISSIFQLQGIALHFATAEYILSIFSHSRNSISTGWIPNAFHTKATPHPSPKPSIILMVFYQQENSPLPHPTPRLTDKGQNCLPRHTCPHNTSPWPVLGSVSIFQEQQVLSVLRYVKVSKKNV